MKLRSATVALLFAFVALAGCTQHFGWHQKLTVTVQTPMGEVSGASVTAVEVDGFDGLLPDGGGVESRLTGEAVVVEIAPGRYLFVLLTGALGWADAAYGLGGPGTVFEENMRSVEAQRGKPPVPLPPKAWPLMVTFTDIADPKTVALVDPDDLSAPFGPGVRLKAVTLAVTEEPVTEGKVEAVLGWVNDLKKYRTDPDNPFTNTLPAEIGYLMSR
ncbi:hypothetical protein [Stagnihabitans tardus]|uniref:Lipoprotein n=1 Tax=Stagnihabitans tardus TaxID=2699202 RepID=A0AAE5BUA3_9RHOB|nr:hypothetical protein [Stagnihabitans tardus]NBZ87037.1 hypothetical protein [Stagnihabitans tardus]